MLATHLKKIKKETEKAIKFIDRELEKIQAEISEYRASAEFNHDGLTVLQEQESQIICDKAFLSCLLKRLEIRLQS